MCLYYSAIIFNRWTGFQQFIFLRVFVGIGKKWFESGHVTFFVVIEIIIFSFILILIHRQSSGAKEEMEIESAQNFTETPSAEGASSSKEMQEQDAHSGAVPVRSNAIENDGSELDRGSLLNLLVCSLNVTQFSTCSYHAVILSDWTITSWYWPECYWLHCLNWFDPNSIQLDWFECS